MSAYANTKIDIPSEARNEVIAVLNQQLADTFDLFSQIKQAHWNVKGMHFIALHQLFDKLAEEAEEFVDDMAERATALGGVAIGTARASGKASRLPEFPLQGVHGNSAVGARCARCGIRPCSGGHPTTRHDWRPTSHIDGFIDVA